MGKGLFVTGTGTDVGKTVVTAGLLRMLRAADLDAVSMKPVQTGCTPAGKGWRVPDLEAHWAAAAYQPPVDEAPWMSPYCYAPACSPHLAGAATGQYPEIAAIEEAYGALASRHEAVLVEGAGGILVPLDDTHTMRDLMRALRLPVLLVATAGLGTINHTLLSIAALRAADLDVAGVVLSATDPHADRQIHEDNPRTIAAFGEVPILGRIPWIGGENGLDWNAFAAGMTGFDTLRRSFQ